LDCNTPGHSIVDVSTEPPTGQCSYCGCQAGISLVPRAVRTPLDSIRCLSCLRDTPAIVWFNAARSETNAQAVAKTG
jgi:hypothetical protein